MPKARIQKSGFMVDSFLSLVGEPGFSRLVRGQFRNTNTANANKLLISVGVGDDVNSSFVVISQGIGEYPNPLNFEPIS